MKQSREDALSSLRKEIQAELKRRKMTMEAFCWEHDLNKATLSNLMNDKKDFRVSTLLQIAAAMGRRLEISIK